MKLPCQNVFEKWSCYDLWGGKDESPTHEKMLAIRIIAAIFLGIWLLLLLLGKGGFIHLLLLTGIGFAAVDLACIHRGRTTIK